MSPSASPSPLVVGLDIGTTKICAIVAGEDENGALSVRGLGAQPSSGVRRGVVVDVPDTVSSIKAALARASHMAGVEIEGVIAGVTGDHILSQNRLGSVTVASSGGEVAPFDVDRALAATLLEIGRDREVIHCSPRSFALDGQKGVRRPVGMIGSRLEVEAHVVTGDTAILRNTFRCLSEVPVRADALALEPLATAAAVTTKAERDMGVLVLDIGGGTSDLAAFVDGSAIYSAALPVGGNHVTRDISIGLSTPFEFAERLKVASGAATRDMIPHGEALEVMTAGGASRLRIPRALLGEIIEARMRELFELCLVMARESDLAGRVPGGLILSGGGALLPGALELGSKIFGLPTRLGVPTGVVGWREQVASPQFATAVGLCRIALAQLGPGEGRSLLALPHARRVWSQLPRAVVMACPVASEPNDSTARETAEKTARPAEAPPAPLASEEFPAQMQFAPTSVGAPATASTPSALEPISSESAPSVSANASAPVEASEKAAEPVAPESKPGDGSGRSRLQEMLSRMNATEASPGAAKPSASEGTPTVLASEEAAVSNEAPVPSTALPSALVVGKDTQTDELEVRTPDTKVAEAGSNKALSWWMRFKTFIGFGAEED